MKTNQWGTIILGFLLVLAINMMVFSQDDMTAIEEEKEEPAAMATMEEGQDDSLKVEMIRTKPVQTEADKIKTGPYWCYVGTYTRAPNDVMKELKIGESEGILVAPYDDTKGLFGEFQLAAKVFSPSWLATSPDGRILYAVAEGSPTNATARIFSFQINRETGALYPLNNASTGGGAPCHVAVHSSGKYLCVSNYSGGDFVLYSIEKNGSVGIEIDRFKPTGQGSDLARQAGPHAHGAYFVGNRVFLCDLGTDRVYIKQIDEQTGKLVDDPLGENLEFQGGAGPRHLSMQEKNGKLYIFVCNELDSTVNVFGISASKGIEELGSYFTLWEEYENRVANSPALVDGIELIQYNTTAEVVATSKGNVYVSNRGHDSIAVFDFAVQGDEVTMKLSQLEPTYGKNPRFIGQDPSGKFLFACNQDSASLFTYIIDSQTGQLKGDSTRPRWIPYPVMMLFVGGPPSVP